jgi:hypothetical protein
MSVTPEQARASAQEWLDRYLPGTAAADEADAFYGYYTIHVMNDGRIYGMLSVNGYTGAVRYHTWHGEFVGVREMGIGRCRMLMMNHGEHGTHESQAGRGRPTINCAHCELSGGRVRLLPELWHERENGYLPVLRAGSGPDLEGLSLLRGSVRHECPRHGRARASWVR